MPRSARLGLLALIAVLSLAPAAGAAKAKKVKLAPTGATTLALDSGAAAALQSLGIAVAPLKPARAGDAGIAFPITAGKLDAKTYAGKIKHSGGLALRLGEWKYIPRRPGLRRAQLTETETGNDPDVQLYNLASDPGETKNLAIEQSGKVQELAALLEAEKARGMEPPVKRSATK